MYSFTDEEKKVLRMLYGNNFGSLSFSCSGMDFHPPGGFLSYFQDPSILQNHRPFVPPNYYPAEQVAPCSKLRPGAQQPVNIDSGDEEAHTVRTEKRLTWSTEEDIRLVSK